MLKKALTNDSTYLPAVYLLVDLLIKQEEYDEATQMYVEQRDAVSGQPLTMFWLARERNCRNLPADSPGQCCDWVARDGDLSRANPNTAQS